ncbi:glycosyltransferase [Actinomyces sp. F1_1611]
MTNANNPDGARRRVLVLLTSEFPNAHGDTAFIANEIGALSEQFDRVLVLSKAAPGQNLVPLPNNVEYRGTFNVSPRTLLPELIKPRRLWQIAKETKTEFASPTRAGDFSFTWKSTLTGLKFARLIEQSVDPGDEVFVYSFWGIAVASAFPFLPAGYGKTVRLHGGDLYFERGYQLPLREALFRSADRIALISEHGRRYLLDHFPQLQGDSRVVLSRLGTEDFGVGPKPTGTDPLTVVTCSAVNENKRVLPILQALEELAQSRPVHWIHFGTGPLLGELVTRVSQVQRQQSSLTVDLRGQVSNDQVKDFYRHHPVDVFVNASDSEGVPVSIMEALSAGIPVVATDAGGSGEIVGEELGSGRLLPLQPSASELAAAIVSVADHRGDYHPREVWQRLCNNDRAAREIVDIILSTAK